MSRSRGTPTLNVRLDPNRQRLYADIASETGDTFSDFVRTAMAREAMRRIELNPEVAALVAAEEQPNK